MPKLNLSLLDQMAWSASLLLVAALALVLILGDRAGPALVDFEPIATAGSNTLIRIQFGEEMDRDNVTAFFQIEPPVPGQFGWEGATMIFRPVRPLQPDIEHTVTLGAGAKSQSGRSLQADHEFKFIVREPRIAYLAPADGDAENIWLASPASQEAARQVTFSALGVRDFDVSFDGLQIAFTQRSPQSRASDIYLLDLATGATRPLTNCPQSICRAPVWKPDGGLIAYERIDLNDTSVAQSASGDVTRIWIIDLSASPPLTFPLFANPEIQGSAPQWSTDGRSITMFDAGRQGVIVYNFIDDDFGVIPTRHGSSGAFSPDAGQLIVPEVVVRAGGESRSYLRLAELATQQFLNLSAADDPVDDARADWHPDGRYIAVARRYMDDRWTPGRQLYLLDTQDRSVEPLLLDDDYATGFFDWNPAGDHILLQRTPLVADDSVFGAAGLPEIWTYNPESGETTLIAANSFHPRWLP